ncbi:MAG: LLM class flavin-dependent oxidoreductase [Candidatus Methylomirabilales bacterium]
MKIGVALPAQVAGVTRADVLGFAERAERQGLDSVWVLDRLIYDSLAPLPLLAATAAVTNRVRIGTSVLLATLWSPLLLAKELATIDRLSQGRLIVGMAVGGREPDFQGAQVPMRTRGRRLEETVALLKQAWGGGPVDHDGRAFQVHVPPTGPRATQQPHPPLWLGGFAEDAIRRAVRLGDGFIIGGRGPEYARSVVPQVRRMVAEAGRDPAQFPIAALAYFCLGPDPDRAIQNIADYIPTYYGRLIFEPREAAVYGRAQQAAARMKEFAVLDVDTLVLIPVLRDPEQVDRLVEAVAALQPSQSRTPS